MTHLSSFSPNTNIAVIGASGGIGSAFCRLLISRSMSCTVHALSRREIQFDEDRIHTSFIDLLDEQCIADAAERLRESGPLDLVIVATGLLHHGEVQPEKSMRDIDSANMLDIMRVNTIGPALVAKHFLPIMRRKSKTVFAALSARVGSIEDNRLGGWVSYRASKAALNMTMKTLAIEHARRFPEAAVVSLHPGTVATPLSEPFRSRVPPAQLFDPNVSAAHLLSVIEGLTQADTGGFFAWDGSRIKY